MRRRPQPKSVKPRGTLTGSAKPCQPVWSRGSKGSICPERRRKQRCPGFQSECPEWWISSHLDARTRRRDARAKRCAGHSRGAARERDLALHPTIKPVSPVADALRDCSIKGDILVDLFMGSGTTIMLPKKVGRRAYGCGRHVDLIAALDWRARPPRPRPACQGLNQLPRASTWVGPEGPVNRTASGGVELKASPLRPTDGLRRRAA